MIASPIGGKCLGGGPSLVHATSLHAATKPTDCARAVLQMEPKPKKPMSGYMRFMVTFAAAPGVRAIPTLSPPLQFRVTKRGGDRRVLLRPGCADTVWGWPLCLLAD